MCVSHTEYFAHGKIKGELRGSWHKNNNRINRSKKYEGKKRMHGGYKFQTTLN